MNEAYGTDFFILPVERQYGKRFARDYDALFSEVDKVKEEARYHINLVTTQTETEMRNLRKTIDQKNQEIMALQSSQLEELEKMKQEMIFNMESDFQTREVKCKNPIQVSNNLAFQKFDSQLGDLYRKLRH